LRGLELGFDPEAAPVDALASDEQPLGVGGHEFAVLLRRRELKLTRVVVDTLVCLLPRLLALDREVNCQVLSFLRFVQDLHGDRHRSVFYSDF
jgi:hypothetical protein